MFILNLRILILNLRIKFLFFEFFFLRKERNQSLKATLLDLKYLFSHADDICFSSLLVLQHLHYLTIFLVFTSLFSVFPYFISLIHIFMLISYTLLHISTFLDCTP